MRGFLYHRGGVALAAGAARVGSGHATGRVPAGLARWRRVPTPDPTVLRRVTERPGWAIVAAYPFYGVSAATQVAAGAAGMPLRRFYLALTPVAVVWAGLQTAVGLALLAALAQRAAGWVLAIVVVVLIVQVLRRRRGLPGDPTPPT